MLNAAPMTRRLSILFSFLFSFAFLTGSVLLVGCLRGNDALLSFMIVNPLDENRVVGNPLGGLLGALLPLSFDIAIDLDAETSSRGTGVAQHVFLTDFDLRITSTAEGVLDSDDFTFLDTIDIFIEPRSSSSSLPRERVASLTEVPNGARTISLRTEGIDLIDYFRAGSRLVAEATGSAPIDDVTFDGTVTFTVEVL